MRIIIDEVVPLAQYNPLYALAAPLSMTILTTRPHYAGYYEKASGKPALTKPPSPWSDARSWIFPASIWLLAIYFGSGAVVLALSVRKQLTEAKRALLLLYCLLVSISAVAFLLPVLTMATLDTRYSASFVPAFDMALILLLVALLSWS